jgi:hypothetical protein
MWGCKPHWFRLPREIRNRIWATYKPGQEVTMTPSASYLAVAKQAEQWIRANSAPAPSPRTESKE